MFVEMFRWERIYPFRSPDCHRGSLNGKWSVHTLGNGLAHPVGEAAFADVFIMNSDGYSDNLTLCQIIWCGNSASRSERINPFPTNTLEHFSSNEPRMFTDLSERINPFPTKHTEKFQFFGFMAGAGNFKNGNNFYINIEFSVNIW